LIVKQFEGFEQQDAQELFSFLLDCLHEDLNVVGKKPDTSLSNAEEAALERMSASLAAAREWQRAKQRDCSIVTTLFTGQERSQLIVCVFVICNNAWLTISSARNARLYAQPLFSRSSS